jgi:hypothetical protein
MTTSYYNPVNPRMMERMTCNQLWVSDDGNGRPRSFSREESTEDGMNRQVKPTELFGSSEDITVALSLEKIHSKNSKLEIDMLSVGRE